MKTLTRVVMLIAILGMVSACAPTAPKILATATNTVSVTAIPPTLALTQIVEPTKAATQMQQPTPTVTPTPAPTATQFVSHYPVFTVTGDTSCLQGPSDKIWTWIYIIPKGTTMPILGRSDEAVWGLWWYVEAAGTYDCYVYSGLGTVTGDTNIAPQMTTPPTPKP
jgi:hypothetical protein